MAAVLRRCNIEFAIFPYQPALLDILMLLRHSSVFFESGGACKRIRGLDCDESFGAVFGLTFFPGCLVIFRISGKVLKGDVRKTGIKSVFLRHADSGWKLAVVFF
ncbi:hypothetical protein RQN30_07230 [Arcanobacterium hippocoleae]